MNLLFGLVFWFVISVIVVGYLFGVGVGRNFVEIWVWLIGFLMISFFVGGLFISIINMVFVISFYCKLW